MENMVTSYNDFYRGKRVLVTGHTGFKGSWLSLWLRQLGAEVFGYSLPPVSARNLYEIIQPGAFEAEWLNDIRDQVALGTAITGARPDLIFHLAAQPLVQESYRDPSGTFETNAMGTVNLLEVVRRQCLPCTVVVVTSDKCYANQEWDFGYRENDKLGGHDVYSMSKAVQELITASWRDSFFSSNEKLGHLVSGRAGNVIGGGDFAKDRILPDCIQALAASRPIVVRNPESVRPWQHVLDCLSGYLWLGARVSQVPKNSALVSSFNFGPTAQDFRTVRLLVEEILLHWRGSWETVPSSSFGREAGRLRLAIDKATELLGWQPTWGFAEAVSKSVEWYRAHQSASCVEMRDLTLAQISSFERSAISKGSLWATGDVSA